MLPDERYLWHEGRKVARLSELHSIWAQDYGRQKHTEMRISGPTATRNQRDYARGRGVALPTHVYMRVGLRRIERDEKPVWLCEVLNPKNVDEYLKWFPQMRLERGDEH